MGDDILTLILVRHGLTDWNQQGRLLGRTQVELNASGRAQATAVAQALRNETVHTVLVSPLRRAQQTAEPIARALGLAITTEPDLDEVWLGPWIGKTWDELRDDPDIKCYGADPLHVCDAYEPATAVRERVVRLAERLRESHCRKTVVLVSHGDPLRILVSHYIAMPLGKFRSLKIANGSISRLHLFDRGAQAQLLNWQPSMPP
jgi:broad specificity phosphatase PhoE